MRDVSRTFLQVTSGGVLGSTNDIPQHYRADHRDLIQCCSGGRQFQIIFWMTRRIVYSRWYRAVSNHGEMFSPCTDHLTCKIQVQISTIFLFEYLWCRSGKRCFSRVCGPVPGIFTHAPPRRNTVYYCSIEFKEMSDTPLAYFQKGFNT